MHSELLFEVTSKLGTRIHLTNEYWEIIATKKHPSVAHLLNEAKLALIDPFEVRRSRQDPAIILYYRKRNAKFTCTVAKHLNDDGFVVTVYTTAKIKRGEGLWKSG
jgi:hypothetical protein